VARLLIIEDNPDNLELMTYLLKAFGHETIVAHDGEEGMQTARRERVDLIVCDVHLPKKDGYAIAAELKADARLKDVPLVAVTALAMVGDRDRLLAAGFDGYIAKPIVPQEFVKQVEAFLKSGTTPVVMPSVPVSTYVAPTASPPTAVRARVLVVDDSSINRDLTRAILEPFGYRLTVVASVQEAMAMPGPFDLILSDLHMPDEDGLGFLAAAKADARLRAIPFVLISSSVRGHQDRQRAAALGASRFLLRPMEPQELMQQIEQCLLPALDRK
jgi:two-component system cell cycle response regulator